MITSERLSVRTLSAAQTNLQAHSNSQTTAQFFAVVGSFFTTLDITSADDRNFRIVTVWKRGHAPL
jgi:hypothetical protein